MFSGNIRNKYIEKVIMFVIALAYLLSLFYKIYEVKTEQHLIMAIMAMMILFLIRHYLLNKEILKVSIIHIVIISLELILINMTYYLTDYAVSELIYMIYVTDLIVCYSVKYSIPTAMIGYLFYFSISILKSGSSFDMDAFTNLVTRGLSFTAFIFTLGFFKSTINRNVVMKSLMDELDKKNKELESYVLIKERNRIAGEMHDTVGHTLTTSIVELEAAKMLFYSQPDAAYKKMALASDQVRKSMAEMRSVVKKINGGHHVKTFIQSIEAIASEIKLHTSTQVEIDMLAVDDLLDIQEKVLYNSIKEAITNSIKHGNANEILVTAVKNVDNYVVQIIDNGSGEKNILLGFGLKNMTERVNGIGGTLEYDSDNGFRIEIKIPLQVLNEEKKNE